MLLRAFKSNQPFLFLLIPLTAIGLWISSFVQPTSYPFFKGENEMILYQVISWLLDGKPLLNHITAFLFMVSLSFLVLKLNVQYAFIRMRTFLPSILFILISSGIPELHSMHPVYPATLFLILTIDRIFNSYDKEKIHSNAFESGIFLAIGSLFYFNLTFFFPVIWVGFIILRQRVNWREYILSTLGFVIPWLPALFFYQITGNEQDLNHLIETNFTIHQSFLLKDLPVQIYLGFLILMTLFGSSFLLLQYDEKKVSSRKYFKVFFWIFLMAVILTIAAPAASQEMILILSLPLTYLISNYFIYMKRTIWGEIFFFLLFIGVVILQFI